MSGDSTLILNRSDVERLLTLDACIAAVADILDQCCVIGDLHHAVAAGLMTRSDVHAELGEIIAGSKRGRARDDEIIIFDSSGTGLQDAAAAAAVYQRALGQTGSFRFSFNA